MNFIKIKACFVNSFGENTYYDGFTFIRLSSIESVTINGETASIQTKNQFINIDIETAKNILIKLGVNYE